MDKDAKGGWVRIAVALVVTFVSTSRNGKVVASEETAEHADKVDQSLREYNGGAMTG